MQGDHDLNLVSVLDELHTCTHDQYVYVHMHCFKISTYICIRIQTYQVKQITIIIDLDSTGS